MQTRIYTHFGKNLSLHESVFMYERWYSSDIEPGWYSCFDWTQFSVSNIELRLDLGYRLLRFASRTNLESIPRFAEIWFVFQIVTQSHPHFLSSITWQLGHFRASPVAIRPWKKSNFNSLTEQKLYMITCGLIYNMF